MNQNIQHKQRFRLKVFSAILSSRLTIRTEYNAIQIIYNEYDVHAHISGSDSN